MTAAPTHGRSCLARLCVLAVSVFVGGCGEAGTTTAGGPASVNVPTTSGAPSSASRRLAQKAHRRKRVGPSTALGARTKTSGCQARGQLPDPACTPGAIFRAGTLAQICTSGYSSSVRNVPEWVKRLVYAEYGTAPSTPGSYEVDHLVPLELGGSNRIANLWPQIAPGYQEKDEVENELHDAVCIGTVGLRAGQLAIARDWRHAGVSVPTTESRPSPSPSSSGVSPGGSAEGPGSSSHSDDAAFCASRSCIANFPNGRGTIIQCVDGEWSHSGGLHGVCNRHGGPG